MKDKKISLVIPAYNEAAIIKNTIETALAFMAGSFSDYELIISDDFVIETDTRTRHVAHDGERSRIPAPLKLSIRKDALQVLVPLEPAKAKAD